MFTTKWRLVVVLLFVGVSVLFWGMLAGYNLRWEFTLIPILFAAQIILADFVEHYILTYVGLKGRWFSIVMAPGTILHEFSHLVSALFTGCLITNVSFFKFNPRSNVLGFVEYRQPRDSWIVLRSFLIGFAPFFACGILLVLSHYALTGGALVIDEFSSAETVFVNVTRMVSLYYDSAVNPVLLIIMTYLSICFALGAAPSMTDMKEFFWSLPKHPISALVFLGLIFAVINLGEAQFHVFDYTMSGILIFLFDLAIYVQLASVAVFLAAIPLLLVSDKLIELQLEKRILVFSAAALVYAASQLVFGLEAAQSAAASAVAFLALLAVFRWPNAFVKPKSTRFSSR